MRQEPQFYILAWVGPTAPTSRKYELWIESDVEKGELKIPVR